MTVLSVDDKASVLLKLCWEYNAIRKSKLQLQHVFLWDLVCSELGCTHACFCENATIIVQLTCIFCLTQ